MSHMKLAELVVEFVEYVECIATEYVGDDSALKRLEGVAATLADATVEERVAVMDAARARLARFSGERDEHGYRPRLSREARTARRPRDRPKFRLAIRRDDRAAASTRC